MLSAIANPEFENQMLSQREDLMGCVGWSELKARGHEGTGCLREKQGVKTA